MNKLTEKQQEAIDVIDANGGSTALAKKIGVDGSISPMQVHNWKTRGLPWWFKAQHKDLMLKKPTTKKAA